MRRDQFETHLAQFAQTKAWALCDREAPAALDEVRTYEVASGIELPPEYIDLVTNHGAGQFGFVDVFSVRPGEWSIDIQRLSAPGLPNNFVPVSDNGCGDFYGFLVESGRCASRVVFSDHEENYVVAPTEFSDLYDYVHRFGFTAA